VGMGGAGTNGFVKLAGWGGLGILHMRVRCGLRWVHADVT
jgi:hypothetical protein